MVKKGRMRNGCDHISCIESNQHVKCAFGVPYENASLSERLRPHGLKLSKIIISYLNEERIVPLCPQSQLKPSPDICGQGMGAKKVRLRRPKA